MIDVSYEEREWPNNYVVIIFERLSFRTEPPGIDYASTAVPTSPIEEKCTCKGTREYSIRTDPMYYSKLGSS